MDSPVVLLPVPQEGTPDGASRRSHARLSTPPPPSARTPGCICSCRPRRCAPAARKLPRPVAGARRQRPRPPSAAIPSSPPLCRSAAPGVPANCRTRRAPPGGRRKRRRRAPGCGSQAWTSLHAPTRQAILSLLGLGFMHPRPGPAPAASPDGRRPLRPLPLAARRRRRQVAAAVAIDLLVPTPGQVGAHFPSQTLNVPAGELHVGGDSQGDGDLLEGSQAAGERDDAFQEGRGVAMAVQAQARTQREKNPGDRPGSGQRVRGSSRRRRGCPRGRVARGGRDTAARRRGRGTPPGGLGLVAPGGWRACHRAARGRRRRRPVPGWPGRRRGVGRRRRRRVGPRSCPSGPPHHGYPGVLRG